MRTLSVLLIAVACHHPQAAPPPAPAPEKPIDLHIDDCNAAPARSLTRDQALRDVSALEKILTTGYVAHDPLAKEGLDWTKLVADLRAAVGREPESITGDRFFALVGDALAPVRDSHLNLWTVNPRRFRRPLAHADAYVGDEGATCPGAEPRPFVTGDPPVVKMRPVLLAGAAPNCLGFHRLQLAGDPGKTWEKLDGKVPVVRLRSLEAAHAAELAEFVKSAAPLTGAPAIVVDLRGNDGGDNSYVAKWFFDLTNRTFHYAPVANLASDTTAIGDANAEKCWKLPSGPPKQAGMTTGPGKAVYGLAPKPYVGALVLLADDVCGSSCEWMLQWGREVGAIVVGTNSAGWERFGNVRPYRLPESGIFLQAGETWFQVDPSVEGRGYLPDFWIDDPDPRKEAIALASCLADATCGATLKR